MARVTVQDCLAVVDNRFELVLLAAQAARQIETTMREPSVPANNDKPTVIALREIANGKVDFSKGSDDVKFHSDETEE